MATTLGSANLEGGAESLPQVATAIESTDFPFEHVSQIAEAESWRKEVNRPIYHIHKWWAQRLGSVFRAILIGATSPAGSDVLKLFYQPGQAGSRTVFDPFMGSGTTIGEALKLGLRAIGRDINPVAYLAVRTAISRHARERVIATFREIERDVEPTLRSYYQVKLPDGQIGDALYYFWVKVVVCPECREQVDLFSSYIFAKHAYPARNPDAKAVCPRCDMLSTAHYLAETIVCDGCKQPYSSTGPAGRSSATCPCCRRAFSIMGAVCQGGQPPRHRMYAKLVLTRRGDKLYLPIDESDEALYDSAARALARMNSPYPVVKIEPGYNTNQVLNYCYRYWHQMFNARQLTCLSLLADRIREVRDEDLRNLFTVLFSGTLEFNNMFASYKGEGTGAVRHMFSHHILKPERAPLEANPWGTPKSSGAFSTLFKTRILRALDYMETPFEIRSVKRNGKVEGEKVYGLPDSLGQQIADSYQAFDSGACVYLSCGDSSATPIRSESIDAVVTDPPFFDNVHYSQLADFFYVWERHILGDRLPGAETSTRSPLEVQASEAEQFTRRLQGVWAESHRVLKSHGLLVFSYHHSRPDGWAAILTALAEAGFCIVAAHPIKAELSLATPKHQAREPIDIDMILVCRKQVGPPGGREAPQELLTEASAMVRMQVARFNTTGRLMGRGDVRVMLVAQVICALSRQVSLVESLRWLASQNGELELAVRQLHWEQERMPAALSGEGEQLRLW